MSNPKKKIVFLSYSSEDRDQVEHFEGLFKKDADLNNQFELRSMTSFDSSREWPPQVRENVQKSHKVIAFFSEEYVKSISCLIEAAMAWGIEPKSRLLPAILGDWSEPLELDT